MPKHKDIQTGGTVSTFVPVESRATMFMMKALFCSTFELLAVVASDDGQPLIAHLPPGPAYVPACSIVSVCNVSASTYGVRV